MHNDIDRNLVCNNVVLSIFLVEARTLALSPAPTKFIQCSSVEAYDRLDGVEYEHSKLTKSHFEKF